MAKQLIVVLSDGETWSDIENCQIMALTPEQYARVLDGEKPSWIEDAETVPAFRAYHDSKTIDGL